jgi:hypothetical protein
MKRKLIIKSAVVFAGLLIVPCLVFAQWDLGNLSTTGLPGVGGGAESSIQNIIYSAMRWILTALAALGIIGFVIAGILYLFSGGDDARMKTAKNAMVASIIGVVVGIMGLVIMYAAFNFLSGSSTF